MSLTDTAAGTRSSRMLREGDHVTAPNPAGSGRVPALFMGPVDPDDVPEHGHDLAWVRYTDGGREGTTDHLPYADIRQPTQRS